MHTLTILRLQKLHSLCLLPCCGSPGWQAALLAVLAREALSPLRHNGMVTQAYHVQRPHLVADLRCNNACRRHPKTIARACTLQA